MMKEMRIEGVFIAWRKRFVEVKYSLSAPPAYPRVGVTIKPNSISNVSIQRKS